MPQKISEGDEAMFSLVANTRPWEPIDIRFTPTETATFLGGGLTAMTPTSKMITFPAPDADNLVKFALPIQTVVNSTTNDGTITITLADDTSDPKKYVLNTDTTKRSATVTIKDNPITNSFN